MRNQSVTEILAAHADQLNRKERAKTQAWLAALSGESNEVAPLLDVATRLKRVLQPSPTPPQFRARLRDGLTMAAQHRASQKILIERRDSAWGWIIGVAALGSAAGAIALAVRARNSRSPVSSIAAESPRPN